MSGSMIRHSKEDPISLDILYAQFWTNVFQFSILFPRPHECPYCFSSKFQGQPKIFGKSMLEKKWESCCGIFFPARGQPILAILLAILHKEKYVSDKKK
jgi:hypothetical protein